MNSGVGGRGMATERMEPGTIPHASRRDPHMDADRSGMTQASRSRDSPRIRNPPCPDLRQGDRAGGMGHLFGAVPPHRSRPEVRPRARTSRGAASMFGSEQTDAPPFDYTRLPRGVAVVQSMLGLLPVLGDLSPRAECPLDHGGEAPGDERFGAFSRECLYNYLTFSYRSARPVRNSGLLAPPYGGMESIRRGFLMTGRLMMIARFDERPSDGGLLLVGRLDAAP